MNYSTFKDACDRARHESDCEACTKHVNAVCGVTEMMSGFVKVELPAIIGYQVSDWFSSNATLVSFTLGQRAQYY